jgi:hypothetical protein
VTEVNAPSPLIPCPFCRVLFCNQTDLGKHLKAFQDRDTPINLKDHNAKFREAHWSLEHPNGYEAE